MLALFASQKDESGERGDLWVRVYLFMWDNVFQQPSKKDPSWLLSGCGDGGGGG
jgi:hypothetical protein